MRKKIKIFIILLITSAILTFLLWPKNIPDISLSIVSTIPNNHAFFVDTKSEINFILNKQISIEEGNNIKTIIEPSSKTNVVYQNNKIIITPTEPLKINTDYKINVIYKDKNIYTLEFKTIPLSEEEIKIEGSKQTEGDLSFTKAYNEFLNDYPWYQSLPIEKEEYRIIYDFNKKSFRIRLKIEINDEIRKEAVIQEALKDLTKIGVINPEKNYYVLEVE